eukprot:851642-Prymnesium_polylepis.1
MPDDLDSRSSGGRCPLLALHARERCEQQRGAGTRSRTRRAGCVRDSGTWTGLVIQVANPW